MSTKNPNRPRGCICKRVPLPWAKGFYSWNPDCPADGIPSWPAGLRRRTRWAEKGKT